MSALNNIAVQNTAINAVELIDINQKIVNQAHLDILRFDTLSNAINATELQNIAQQCPLKGGTAVFQARALLSYLRLENMEYNDSLACEMVLIQPKQANFNQNGHTNILSNTLLLFPNPAKEEVNIAYHINNDPVLSLIDIYGRVLSSEKIQKESTFLTLPLTNFQSGIFFIQLNDNIEQKEYFKLKIER